MRTRFTIPEPCLCGAYDCKRCYPFTYRERDEPEDDEPDNTDAELDDLPDVEI